MAPHSLSRHKSQIVNSPTAEKLTSVKRLFNHNDSLLAKGSINCDGTTPNNRELRTYKQDLRVSSKGPFKGIECMDIDTEVAMTTFRSNRAKIPQTHNCAMDIDEGHGATSSFAKACKDVRAGSSLENAIVINDEPAKISKITLRRITGCLRKITANNQANNALLSELRTLCTGAEEDDENLETKHFVECWLWKQNILRRETNSSLILAQRMMKMIDM